MLDIGCGAGYAARTLTKMGAQKVVGIDISASMVIKANAQRLLGQYFVVGSSLDAKTCVMDNFSQVDMMVRI